MACSRGWWGPSALLATVVCLLCVSTSAQEDEREAPLAGATAEEDAAEDLDVIVGRLVKAQAELAVASADAMAAMQEGSSSGGAPDETPEEVREAARAAALASLEATSALLDVVLDNLDEEAASSASPPPP